MSGTYKQPLMMSSWLSLLSHFEGDTFKEMVAKDTNTILCTVIYHGPRKNFPFGDYYSRHSKAHIKLLKEDKPMTVQQQIDSFIAGMKCATAQIIILNVSGDRTIRTSFEIYLQLTNQTSHNENRNDNQFNLNKNKNKNKDRRGNDNRNPKRATQVDPNVGFTPELKVYPHNNGNDFLKKTKQKLKLYTMLLTVEIDLREIITTPIQDRWFLTTILLNEVCHRWIRVHLKWGSNPNIPITSCGVFHGQ